MAERGWTTRGNEKWEADQRERELQSKEHAPVEVEPEDSPEQAGNHAGLEGGGEVDPLHDASRVATAEELEHGHAHGTGGHSD